ncbi:amino acid adenylation domain-containing protein [Streptosporangium sp. CA-135522]|uniref:amino acid adenylation domain-containing protein n=1 Tax=Streptosporangium sp. CA-135522 TaxID=3240072 RepID=UPI003D8AFE08
MRSPCVHELFEAQVSKTPDALAVIDDEVDGETSYAELNLRANRLAHQLRALGVGPESCVGVCLHRGTDMLVVLLAVLKAGGAYVPLDPDYPADRLAYMVADSGAPVVITSRKLEGSVGDYSGVLVYVEDECAGREDNPRPGAHPDNPAYVMYTSGSTGRPKGVVVAHRGVVNRIVWGQEYFGLSSGERLLQKTPYSFDVSVPELFWPLSYGATVVMARPGGHRDPAYLARVINERNISNVHFVPSMLRAFLATPFGALPTLRRLMCTGEALPGDLVAAVYERIGCDVYNLYGPTEATIEVTAAHCLPGESVTIGLPIANTRAHVLDEDFQPVEEGQLCLAGVQLARGYHRRPGLTADLFVPDPHATEPGARLYQTGDLVRRLPDGSIDYLGRLDQQVKIRGNRVELGEIEAALADHPAVAAAAVTCQAGKAGDQRLIAYLVPAEDGADPLRIDSMREWLSRRLPEYMIPTVCVTIGEVPMSVSGKIDRKSLPDPGTARPELDQSYLAPRTSTERALSEIWQDVLEVSPVGVRDAFLDLGGQSLAATAVCARIRQALGAEVSIDAMLTAATVERLGEIVDSAATPVSSIPLAGHRDTGIPLSSAQQQLWLLDRLAPGSADHNLYESYRLRGDLDPDALRLALAGTMARHHVLRTTFPERDGLPYQLVGRDSPVPFEVRDLEGSAAGERAALVMIEEESLRPFSLADGPLVRMLLLRLGAADHILLVVMHHIVADDWSLDVFWRDLCACYRAEIMGNQPELAPLPIQYADYACWQRERSVDSGLDYWRAHLDGVPLELELPLDHPRGAQGASAEAVVELTLPAETMRTVAVTSKASGATPFMTMLAAYVATISLSTGRDDFVIGTFAGNRTRIETENLVGLFVNTLALRMRCAGDPSFAELLGRVRSAALGAYRHPDTPFDRLVTVMRPPRDLSRNPIVQVGFQSLGARTSRVALPGIVCSPVRAGQSGTTLDLLTIVRDDTVEVHYRRDLFTQATADTFAGDFAAVLAAGAGQPEIRLSGLR